MTKDSGDISTDGSDELLFADEITGDSTAIVPGRDTWKVLIVDDEKEVHNVTRLALEDFSFERREITFISAFSAAEAKSIIKDQIDVAVILLDVVMETDHAGLDVTKYIREDLGNHLVRIILRTGQPGSAPEKRVIIDYDINDYKEKTELTSQKLFTAMVASLRTYRHLASIDYGKRGLEKIIEASPAIFRLESLERFVSGVFIQLVSLLQLSENSIYVKTSGFATVCRDGELKVILGTGIYEQHVGECVVDAVSDEAMRNIRDAAIRRRSLYFDSHCIIYFHARNVGDNIIYLDQLRALDKWDIDLLELFCKNISTAYENVFDFQRLIDEDRQAKRLSRDDSPAVSSRAENVKSGDPTCE